MDNKYSYIVDYSKISAEINELSFKGEKFIVDRVNSQDPILFENILEKPNSHRGMPTQVISLALETYQVGSKKVPSRIVILNDQGQTVLDTLIRYDGQDEIPVSTGPKLILKEIADKYGPTLTQIKPTLLNLIRGRTLVAYHILMKLTDIGISDDLEQADIDRTLDCSMMFNPDSVKTQTQMEVLCREYLNLAFKKKTKKSQPAAHTEAKISMALYHARIQLLNKKMSLLNKIQNQEIITSSNIENINPNFQVNTQTVASQVHPSEIQSMTQQIGSLRITQINTSTVKTAEVNLVTEPKALGEVMQQPLTDKALDQQKNIVKVSGKELKEIIRDEVKKYFSELTMDFQELLANKK